MLLDKESQNNQNKENDSLVLQILQITVDILFLIGKILYIIIVSFIRLFVTSVPKSVKGEIVLITGGGHGMGKELALLYASEGATVIVWDINQETGTKTVEEISKNGYPKAYYYTCDVSNRENVFKVAEQVQKEVGDVTILINNAGIMPTRPILEQTPEEIERMMNINVMAHFWTLHAFLPAMKRNNYGHIVAMSSCAGLMGSANVIPYCASKFAVRGMMEALHEELRKENSQNQIKLTLICPYFVDTGLAKRPFMRFGNIMPMLQPQDVAREIMNAQRCDLDMITVPKFILPIQNFGRLLPIKAQMQLIDFFDVGLHPDN